MYDFAFVLDNYNNAKENLIIKVVNENNVGSSFVVHKKEDLAFIVTVNIDDAYAYVTEELVNSWNVSKATLFVDAMQNTMRERKQIIQSLPNVLSMLSCDIDPNDCEFDTKVVTNESMVFGASAIFYGNTMQKLSDEMESDLIILPSSIHEVLVIPSKVLDKDVTLDSLANIVREVNATTVLPEERLSDGVYVYSRTAGFYKAR